jgi:acyl CoA:acetate/3-ketoacid CoA transferase alpha subunit/acyl CoA:acetate/3-ketoacid CoA transferase beta subunit
MTVMTLAEAVRTHVQPGMHLNFASTPSRSNASVREVARQFKGKNPRFEISSTGFHSALHMLAVLRLGARYVACFFGDNYPVPRPNDLYTELEKEGAEIEMWSLWSYVSALRAGALGQPEAVTSSLLGTTMGRDLEKLGKLRVVAGEEGETALVKAMRSDITFVHGLLGDEEGNVVFSPPHSEGFWGAIGARTGVIATVERVVTTAASAQFSDAMKIPPHRILAVCEAPFGTHPQPLYAAPRFGALGYADDFEHYELWRALSGDEQAFARFVQEVLDAPDMDAAYRAFVGDERMDALVGVGRAVREEAKPPQPSRGPTTRPKPSSGPVTTPVPFLNPLTHDSTSDSVNVTIRKHRAKVETTGSQKPFDALMPTRLDDLTGPVPPLGKPKPREKQRSDGPARANEIMLVLAARVIAERIREKRYPIILAGIGHAFLASRMAKLWLADEGIDVKVMVETGLFDLECGPRADEFLLSYRNTALAKRHSSVEDILGTITCGADSVCLGVIGAGQIDRFAHVNSSRINGKLLVGSGGANDITSSAAEVIVLTRCSRSRLVDEVEYITSPGHRIRTIATDLCTLRRGDIDGWSVSDVYPAHGGRSLEHAIEVIRSECVWPLEVSEDLEYAQLISTNEMATVHKLDPFGVHWRREK